MTRILARNGLKAALGALLVLASVVPGLAAGRFMQTGAITSQPIGHYEFCQSHPGECGAHATDPSAAKVTEFGWKLVQKINSQVNQTIIPMTDQDLFGRQEVWAYPTDAGDCEDYVLEKRRDLIKKGFSPADLLITVVRKPDGEGHAVLTLHTTAGDYVLDNLDNQVKLWSQTPYRFLKRQASFNSGRWVTIENSADVVVGAVRN